MGTLNKVILIGRVGYLSLKEKVKPNGMKSKILEMSIVTSKFVKKQDGGYDEQSTWHNIVVYTDSIVDYVMQKIQSGDEIYLEGTLEVSVDSANNRKYWKIVVGYGGTISLFNKKRGNEMGDDDSQKGANNRVFDEYSKSKSSNAGEWNGENLESYNQSKYSGKVSYKNNSEDLSDNEDDVFDKYASAKKNNKNLNDSEVDF
jgi:single stranded DNA-binding protein